MIYEFQLVCHDGTSFPISEQGLIIRRHSTNDIVIADANVSRQHARISIAAGKCWIRDENSALGTIVNGQPVPGQQEYKIGDVLHIGNTAFRLILLEQHPILSEGNKRGNQNMVFIEGGVIFLLAVLAVFMGSSGPMFGGVQPDDTGGLFAEPTQDPWVIAVSYAQSLLSASPDFEEHLASYIDTAKEIDGYLIFAYEAQVLLNAIDTLQNLEIPFVGNAWDALISALNLRRPGLGLTLSTVESGL
ncbi:MAG: FHA domain-containing protein [FCB group bacterium]|nr:FHA domain-containing protein [FCB group bacterium]